MDLETKQFVNECLREASEDIRSRQERMESDPVFRAEEEQRLHREQAEIRLSGAYALEQLERNGGVLITYN
jgi:hypothetical protein